MIQIQGIDRVDLTHRIDDVRQRIAAIENKFGIGGDFQTKLDGELAKQSAAQKVSPTQKSAASQKMPGTTQPANETAALNAAKIAEALKAEKTPKVSNTPKSKQDLPRVDLSPQQQSGQLPRAEALPGKIMNPTVTNPAEGNSGAAISPKTAGKVETNQPDDEEIYQADPPSGTTSEMLTAAARKYGLDPNLVKAIATAESNMTQSEISSAGAVGVMQLMPETAAQLGVDPYDEAQNIDGGTRFLKQMLDKFDGDIPKAVAAYNAGPGAVQQYGGIPPYGETQSYVKRVMDLYR